MTTATGTTLQDATHLHLIDDPLRLVVTSQGDLVRMSYCDWYAYPDEQLGFFFIHPAAEYTVDGVPYFRGNGNQMHMFTLKEADDCWSDSDEIDEEGTCICGPVDYVPKSYAYGEIDEDAWLKHGIVIGKGEPRW